MLKPASQGVHSKTKENKSCRCHVERQLAASDSEAAPAKLSPPESWSNPHNLVGERKIRFFQLSGDFPLNHKKQTWSKCFPTTMIKTCGQNRRETERGGFQSAACCSGNDQGLGMNLIALQGNRVHSKILKSPPNTNLQKEHIIYPTHMFYGFLSKKTNRLIYIYIYV